MYYALSSVKESGAPFSLEGIGILYENFPFKKEIDFGYFPWYGYDTRDQCPLPEKGVVFCKRGVFDFLIRRVSSNIYIVSEVFMRAALDLSCCLKAVPVRVLDKNGQCAGRQNYFLIRVPRVNFYDVIDVGESDFYEKDGWFVLNRMNVKCSCKIPLFIISDVDFSHKTVIVSEDFFLRLKGRGKGVSFFPVDKARWRDVDDILAQDLSEKGVVWPV
jgi:hypothetical protein